MLDFVYLLRKWIKKYRLGSHFVTNAVISSQPFPDIRCDRTWHCCGRWEEERSHSPGAEVEEGEAGHASKSEAWEGHYPQGVRYVGLSEEIGGNKLKDSLMFGDSHDVEDS